MKAVKCPVCDGSGKYRATDGNGAWVESPCHGCGGKGWVTVPDDDAGGYRYVPTYPQFPYYPTYPSWPWPLNEPIITYFR